LRIPLALDYGLAVYPDDGELQEVLIRVADERLYQLKNGTRAAAPAPAPAPTPAPAPAPTPAPAPEPAPIPRPPASEPKRGVAPAAKPPVKPSATAEPSPAAEAKPSTTERRQWERVTLANTRAYALIGEGVERTARVLDLGYGGVAVETPRPEDFTEAFHAVLHVPILPPVRVNLRRIYQMRLSSGMTRIGCAFVT
jgi:hypothetical protein